MHIIKKIWRVPWSECESRTVLGEPLRAVYRYIAAGRGKAHIVQAVLAESQSDVVNDARGGHDTGFVLRSSKQQPMLPRFETAIAADDRSELPAGVAKRPCFVVNVAPVAPRVWVTDLHMMDALLR